MSLEGKQLGEFEIIEGIGRGGMGAVYKARQASLERTVALKTLQSSLTEDQGFIARFRQEAKVAAVLNHPNLVQVYSAGENDGLHWFAMEYVQGESAKDRLQREGRIDPLEAVAIAMHVATGLDYGWRKAGLIHRDIKPDNIFLSSDSEVKLGDLGLARSATRAQGLTMTGDSMGTPHYMSPEQMQAMKSVDLRSDIYSLGCTLYHLLCGQPPYVGESAAAVMIKHITDPAPDLRSSWPDCPAELAAAVGKMMQKLPADRQQSYEEVNADLRGAYDVLSGTSARGVVAVAQKPAVESKRGVPVPVWVGGATLLAVIAALFHFAPWKKADSALQGTRATTPTGAAATHGAATKDRPFVNTLGMKFVPIPGTKALFSIWDTRVQDYRAYATATGARDTYMNVAKDGIPVSREDDYPVVGVSWDDAEAFSLWLTGKEQAEGKLPKGAKYRLPTDEEWSLAVGLPPEKGSTPREKGAKGAAIFPWGLDFPPKERVGNFADESFHATFPADETANVPWKRNQWFKGYTDGFATTSPVDAFPPNAYGLHDMGSNLAQWCEDWFDASQTERVQRGGSWEDCDRIILLLPRRYHTQPTWTGYRFGFRCALELPEK